MSDGTNGTVGVLQPVGADRLVDNSVMLDGTYRQRVDAPTIADLLGNIEAYLSILVSKTAQQNVAGQVRSMLETGSTTAVTGTLTGVTTVTTVTTCTTVGTVSNITSIGGLAASYDQINACNMLAYNLRDRIVVAA